MEQKEIKEMEEVEQKIDLIRMQNKHDFDYLLILDFEATCCDKQKLEVQEIIEFPIVILDLNTNQILKEEYHTYVKPKHHPILSQFCTELTKITQQQVDAGLLLEDALLQAEQFLKKMGILDKSFAFVCCGDFDLGKCLRLEAKYKSIQYPNCFKSYINIKKVFPVSWYTPSILKWNKPPGMAAMLTALNMPLQGTHHSGIDDSRNIARIAQYMVSNNISFTKEMLVSIIEDKADRRKREKAEQQEKKKEKKQEKRALKNQQKEVQVEDQEYQEEAEN